nr:immunoglobulin light chain junction region [Macaca mulatta]MOW72985.1 immunoglobulin light chain junction region [Macaca mulatta]MOW73565.1 immunoglobulin light chain junction region [Macaca mulatta]MOW73730.1 immunoglobulin light chain junction region [Macaca mulatta]MOW74131.1 immunoglobulin light chain junction region [Macaca mulatta]
CMQGLELYSF